MSIEKKEFKRGRGKPSERSYAEELLSKVRRVAPEQFVLGAPRRYVPSLYKTQILLDPDEGEDETQYEAWARVTATTGPMTADDLLKIQINDPTKHYVAATLADVDLDTPCGKCKSSVRDHLKNNVAVHAFPWMCKI